MADYNSAYTGAEIDQGVGNGLAAPTTYAPIAHDSTATTYGKGTDTKYGHLKLSASTSSTSGTSGGIAATPSAVKAAYDLANSKQSPATTLAGYGITDAATSAELGTFVRPNLLDNWYFVGGGSQQGGGQFPINQRGNTSYSAGAYSIDRWYNRQYTTASLVSNGLKLELTNTGGYPFFTQRLENYQDYLGKTVTVSVMIAAVSANFKGVRIGIDASNSVSTNSYSWPQTSPFYTTPGVYSVTITLPDTIEYSGLNMSLYFGANNRAIGDYCVISAVKMEQGDTQTLAHQENGTWVLNEIPNYEDQLARCQRFFFALRENMHGYSYFGQGVAESATTIAILAYLPVPMRNTMPVITSIGSFRCVGSSNLSVSAIGLAIESAQPFGNKALLTATVSGATVGSSYSLQANNSTTAMISLSADL